MIEVEKKFVLAPDREMLILQESTFLKEVVFTDSYFDYADWRMTTTDTWLRSRDGAWELKVPLNTVGKNRFSDQYREIETEVEIIAYLGFDTSKSLAQSLAEKGIVAFCTITTTRRKYSRNDFTIDVDTMDFGYHLCEIEKMVETEDQIADAEREIMVFAKSFDLPTTRVRGKVLEYLRRNNPAHMKAIEAYTTK